MKWITLLFQFYSWENWGTEKGKEICTMFLRYKMWTLGSKSSQAGSKYSWRLSETCLNCMGPIIGRFFSISKYSRPLYPWVLHPHVQNSIFHLKLKICSWKCFQSAKNWKCRGKGTYYIVKNYMWIFIVWGSWPLTPHCSRVKCTIMRDNLVGRYGTNYGLLEYFYSNIALLLVRSGEKHEQAEELRCYKSH